MIIPSSVAEEDKSYLKEHPNRGTVIISNDRDLELKEGEVVAVANYIFTSDNQDIFVYAGELYFLIPESSVLFIYE